MQVLPVRCLYRRRIVFAISATFALILAIILLKYCDIAASRSRAELLAAQVRLAEAEELKLKAQRLADRYKLANHLLSEADTAGFAARDWDERRFNIRQVSMSRVALNELLQEIDRTPGRLFAAEQFEISVKRPEDSLFTSPHVADSDVVVTLKGSLIFRATGTSP